MLSDYTGREYALGDYVFCAVTSYDTTSTFVGKVCAIGERALTVVKYFSYREGSGGFRKIVLQKPKRDIIISEEIAAIRNPELLGYSVAPKEYTHKDALGAIYKVGDYIFVAQHHSNSSVRTYFAKVLKINPESIQIYRNSGHLWRKQLMESSVLRVPERHMIVSREIAINAEPMLDH